MELHSRCIRHHEINFHFHPTPLICPLFFSAYSCPSALHFMLLPVAPGLSLSINPNPHLSLIHSEGRKPLGDCGVQTGLCSNTCIWPWGSDVSLRMTWEKKEIVFIVSLIDSNILCIDFSWSNCAALCQGRLPVSLPWTEYSCCRRRERANAAVYSYPSMQGNMDK